MNIDRRALERARETVWQLRDDERMTHYLKEHGTMTKRKTPVGDQVDKPQSTSGTRKRLDDLYRTATGALDNVMAASKREATIDATQSVDKRRFPALGE